MTRALVLTPSPRAPKPEPFKLLHQPRVERVCFGTPRLNTRKCLKCADFDLCFHRHLSIVKQARIKL